MPDEAPVVPAPAAAPTPEAQPSAQSQAPSGIEAAMKDFEPLVTPKPKEAAKAPDKPAEPAKPEPAKPDATKPAPAKKEDVWSKAPGNLKGEHFKTVRQLEEKISNYEKQIKAIEAKPKESAGDAKLVEDYQKRIADYEKRVAALDYRSSDAFKKTHERRINAEYAENVKEIASLKVYAKDADGNETSRAATKADFDRLFSMSPAEQDAEIAKFGPSHYRVAEMMRNLVRMQRIADQDVQEHAEKAEMTAKEQQLASEREHGAYKTAYESSIADLQKTWPQYFAPDENDPEASAALDGGYKYVDEVLSKAEAMNTHDRAAYNAVLRARAAGFPRAILDNNRLRAEVESLKSELGKYRKSDPGAGESAPAAPSKGPDDDIPQGIEAAAAAMAKG